MTKMPEAPFPWYAGKKVFVTGGSSGIGKAAAGLLAQSGAQVAIAARGVDRLQAASDEIHAGTGRSVFAIGCDVSDPDRMRSVAKEAVETLGGIDVLINNAGVAHPATVAETSDEVYERMMEINYFGTVHCTRAFLPYFVEQGSGHIANVSSLLGFMGIYGYTAYAASKHAVTGFSECLRQEMLAHGVVVSVMFPGDTDTPQLAQENEIKPAETKAIAGKVKVMSAEAVAATLLDGIRREKFHILAGFDSRLTYTMYRHFPRLVRWLIDRPLEQFQRDRSAPPS